MKNTIFKIGRLAFMAMPIVALVGLSTQAKAATCTNQSVVAGTSCTLGDLTFTFIAVNTLPSGEDVGLETPPTGSSGGTTTLGFEVPAGATDIHLIYEVQSSADDIVGVDSFFPMAGGSSTPSINENVCGNDPSKGPCNPFITNLDNTTPNVIEFSSSFGPFSTIYIDKDVSNNGFSDFQDSIEESSPAPEPSSLALLGTTLLGAAGVARRRLKIR